MAVDSALTKTVAATGGAAVKNRYYDKLFLKVAENQLVHKQVGQLNRNIGQGEGGYGANVVYWTRWSNLPIMTAAGAEGVPTTAVGMTAANVTGSTAQYDAAVSISDLLAYTSFGDIMKTAMERLAYNAGLSIDTIILNEVKCSGGVLTPVSTVSAQAAYTGIPSTATFNVTTLKQAVRKLLRQDSKPMGDGFYVATIHPDVLYDLQVDTTVGSWVTANIYTEAGQQKLYKGEVGRLHQVKFLQTTNPVMVRGTSLMSGSGSVYVTNVFGEDAFGVTELQSLKTYVKSFDSGGTGDPTNKVATAGWKTTFGAATLNTSFFVNVNTQVSATA
jgi:N4-gp56 family major capsid protein